MPDPLPADRLPTKTDAQARSRYFDFLQQSLSAVSDSAIWRAAPVPEEGHGMYSAFTVPDTVALRGPDQTFYLRATQRFEYGDDERHKGERKVVTAQYVYTLAEDAELGAELLSWQWHPGKWSDPHVHIRENRKLHVPTGRVAFEQVLLFAITDLGVEPKKDALSNLGDSLRRFRMWKTW